MACTASCWGDCGDKPQGVTLPQKVFATRKESFGWFWLSLLFSHCHGCLSRWFWYLGKYVLYSVCCQATKKRTFCYSSKTTLGLSQLVGLFITWKNNDLRVFLFIYSMKNSVCFFYINHEIEHLIHVFVIFHQWIVYLIHVFITFHPWSAN